jgi:hypothetical protein
METTIHKLKGANMDIDLATNASLYDSQAHYQND